MGPVPSNSMATSARVADVDQSVKDYAEKMKEGLRSEYVAASQRARNLNRQLDDLRQRFISFKDSSAKFRGIKEEIDRNWNTHSQIQIN